MSDAEKPVWVSATVAGDGWHSVYSYIGYEVTIYSAGTMAVRDPEFCSRPFMLREGWLEALTYCFNDAPKRVGALPNVSADE